MKNESEWNIALAAWFFGPDAADRPVYLSVDDETLFDIAKANSWELEDPSEDLLSAVRPRVRRGKTPFQSWVDRRNDWRQAPSDTPAVPSFLALLAVTVLAATSDRVDRTGKGAGAYYRPLRQLLHMDGSGTVEGYDDVHLLWSTLARWLKEADNAHGLPTAKALGRQSNIGWALSQAVLRGHERARLAEFFDAIGAEPGSVLEPDDLLPRFRHWAAGRSSLTAQLRRSLSDPDTAEALGEILVSELRFWDGAIRDAAGHRVIRVLPHLDLYRSRLQSVAFVPKGVPALALDLNGTVITLPAGPRFAALPTVPCPLDFKVPRAWEAGNLKLRDDIDRLVVFRPDDDVGGYVPARRAEYGEKHFVLVHDSLKEAALAFFRRYAGDPATTRKVPLPPGWTLFRDVVLKVSNAEVQPELRPLLPRTDVLPQLIGGLPVDGPRRWYLTTGAPDFLVPGLDEPLDVYLDDKLIETVDATGTLIRLNDLALATGTHTVRVGSITFTFTLVDHVVDWPVTATLAHKLYRFPHGYLPERMGAPGPPSAVSIVGASLDTDGHDPALLPSDTQMIKEAHGGYLVLGAPGKVARVQMEQPAWAKERRLGFNAIELHLLEEQAGFKAWWVARLFRDRAHLVQVDDHTAGPFREGQEDLVAWRETIEELVTTLEIPGPAIDPWFAYVNSELTDA